MHSKLWTHACNYIVPKLLVLESLFHFHFRGDCVWYSFRRQGMFAILKLFLFAIKVVMDQEQSNGRSPSGGAYWVRVSPVSRAASARKALLPPLHWAVALFLPRTLSSHTCEGWEAGEEREFTVFFIRPQSLLLYPQWWTVSIFRIANHGSPKAWFDGSAEVPQHWAGTKSISPAEAIFNPPLFVSDPTVMWSRGESFCLADLGDKLSSFFH